MYFKRCTDKYYTNSGGGEDTSKLERLEKASRRGRVWAGIWARSGTWTHEDKAFQEQRSASMLHLSDRPGRLGSSKRKQLNEGPGTSTREEGKEVSTVIYQPEAYG